MRALLLTVLVAALVGGLSAWAGASYAMHRREHPASVHELLHERLRLDDAQRRQIEDLEMQHAVRREALEREMRAANSELARALREHHAFTSEVQGAIDHFHHAMGDLQKETITHILAMRAVLRTDQLGPFDEIVARSLTATAP